MEKIYIPREPSKDLWHYWWPKETIIKEKDEPNRIIYTIEVDYYVTYPKAKDPDKKEYVFTKVIKRIKPKNLAIGGPLNGHYITNDMGRQQNYVQYNRSIGSKDYPSIIMLHVGLMEGL